MTRPAPIRIGISSLDVAALPLYAQARGAFAQAGLDVAVERDLGHPNEVAALVEAGTLQLGYVDIVTALRALQRGAAVPLAPGARYDAAAPIVVLAVAPGSAARSAREIAAAPIVTPGEHDLARLGVRAWVARAGGDPAAIRFRSGIPMARAAEFLAAGTAGAMIVSEPQRTLQAAELHEAAAPFDAIAPAFVMGAYLAGRAWCACEAPAAAALRGVLAETAAWANAHRSETALLLAERLAFDPARLSAMRRAAYAEEWDAAHLMPVLDAAVRYGEIAPIAAGDVATAARAAT